MLGKIKSLLARYGMPLAVGAIGLTLLGVQLPQIALGALGGIAVGAAVVALLKR